jgi:hypothetical protein
MTISRPIKILVGVLTAFAVLFPFIIMPSFFMFLMYSSGFPVFDPQSLANPYEFEKSFMPMMLVFYPVMMCFSLVQLGLQVFYIVHEIKNKALTDTFRILFALGTFFMPFIAMPIYFIAYLWKDGSGEAKPPAA